MKRQPTDTPIVFNRYTVCSYVFSHKPPLMHKTTPSVVITDIDNYTVCIPSIYTKGVGALNQFSSYSVSSQGIDSNWTLVIQRNSLCLRGSSKSDLKKQANQEVELKGTHLELSH